MSLTFETIIEHTIAARNGADLSNARTELAEYEEQVSSERFREAVNTSIRGLLRRILDDPSSSYPLFLACFRVLDMLFEQGHPVLEEMFQIERNEDLATTQLYFGIINVPIAVKRMDDDPLDGILASLVNIMNREPNDFKIQARTIACIHHFDFGQEACDAVMASNLTSAVLRSMRIHSDEGVVQHYGLKVLARFYSVAAAEEWPPVTTLQAMNKFTICEDVQTSGCAFLNSLLPSNDDDDDEALIEILATLSGSDYIQAVVQAMRNHLDNEELQENAIEFFRKLTKSRDPRRRFPASAVSRIVEGGGVQVILEAMRTRNFAYNTIPRRAIIVSSASSVLCQTLRNNAKARRIATVAGGISIILENLRYPAFWPFAGVEMMYTLLNLLFPVNGEGNPIVDLGGIKTVVDAAVVTVDTAEHWHASFTSSRFRLTDDIILAQLAAFACASGMLPLHYAAASCGGNRKTGQVAVIEHLLAAYPEAAEIRDHRGRLPFHIAVEERAHVSVLECLSQAYSEATRARDGEGRLPLHVAVESKNTSLLVLEYLLRVCSEATAICDGKDRLPVHVAVEVNASLDKLNALLRVDPSCGEAPYIRKNDAMLNFPPFLMAAANDCDLDILFTLLRSFPTITKRHGKLSVRRKRKSRG